ncbi:MAG: murein biosynthesis integral membrane protein MurJ [Candidatus Binatia bacterium]|jgi:putative peptidoglycan lipid II flippase
MSENRRIVRAAGLVGFFTLLSRIAGLVRDAVIGYYFGTGIAADAFFVAFRIPNLLRRFVAEGAMSVAFVPVFTEYLTKRSRREAVEAASALATVMAAVLLVLTMLGVAFAPLWTSLFAPGFSEAPDKFALTVTLTRWVFPYIFLVSLVALASGILNSLRHFAAPAAAPIFLNLSIISAAVWLSPRLSTPIYGVAYGVLIGGLVQLAVQIPPLLRHGVRIVPRWQPRHEAVRRALGLMAPMVFGAAVYQVNLMISTMLASVLPSGSVSYLWYADRVFEFPLGIFAVALGTAALPSFSAQAARRAYAELRQSLAFSIRITNVIALPATVGMITLAMPIVSVLFQRGAFGAPEVTPTTQALCAFAVGLWPVSMARLVVPAFYALGDTRTPVNAAAVAFVVNCTCCLLLMGPAASSGDSRLADAIAALTRTLSVVDLRHAGLALSTSVAASVNLLVLFLVLRRRLGALGGDRILASFFRALGASLAMVPVVRYIAGLTTWSDPGHTVVHAAVLTAAIVAGGLVFTMVALALGGDEVRALTALMRQRLGALAVRRD